MRSITECILIRRKNAYFISTSFIRRGLFYGDITRVSNIFGKTEVNGCIPGDPFDWLINLRANHGRIVSGIVTKELIVDNIDGRCAVPETNKKCAKYNGRACVKNGQIFVNTIAYLHTYYSYDDKDKVGWTTNELCGNHLLMMTRCTYYAVKWRAE